ncbi:hypothetical protein EV663_101236 [Rhodovulum bhavnagarense]|uniref:Methyltransferase family protein n=1 Tax=Rhodovulum bhavnagarense TaxID=992286 RepID=A0A4R2RIW6_9RHOB|nr:class I SAM-dependent methyltransferase [Rhodovulum bhavnagarense]TCP62973.1 hypothetical protein EV663_101236 [Rhodovulum bhavnagarense]
MALQHDIEQALSEPEITGLDVSVLEQGDLLNIVLQRSEVLFDVPRAGQVIRAWREGDEGPIRAQVDRLGGDIARRAAAVIWREFQALRPDLDQIRPKRIADIGAGYAFFDLFAARAYGARLLLIDLESNEARHFGFQKEGAAYSSLAVARRFLECNGVAADDIRTLNPRDADPLAAGEVDLAVSFLSCGFHYPVDTYLAFFEQAVKPGGAVIVDLRDRAAAEQAEALAALGHLRDLSAPDKARRVMLIRGSA